MMYHINKGINKPIEFKGLKAQYIGYLGAGLVSLLILFAILYLLSVPLSICLLVTVVLGAVLFDRVFKLSRKYGPHGLMKHRAKKYLPTYLKFKSRRLFYEGR